jgi:hypothetical protein
MGHRMQHNHIELVWVMLKRDAPSSTAISDCSMLRDILVYDLRNDVVSTSDFTVSNCRMMNER